MLLSQIHCHSRRLMESSNFTDIVYYPVVLPILKLYFFFQTKLIKNYRKVVIQGKKTCPLLYII